MTTPAQRLAELVSDVKRQQWHRYCPDYDEVTKFARDNAAAIAARERELEAWNAKFESLSKAQDETIQAQQKQLAAKDAEIAKLRAALTDIADGQGCTNFCRNGYHEVNVCTKWIVDEVAEALKPSEATD